MARAGVAAAVIRVRRPTHDRRASARFTSCSEVFEASWTVQVAADKEALLAQVSAWLDAVWEEPADP
jgi:hypothetical protein